MSDAGVGPFVIVTLTLFVIATMVTGYYVISLHRIEWDDRPAMREHMRRMLFAMGCWQVTIGMVLIASGQASNSIAVIGMGVLLIVAAWHNVFTGLR